MPRRLRTPLASAPGAPQARRLLAALAAAAAPAWAATECVSMDSGELRLSNASGCSAQLRHDPAVRRAAVRHIHAGLDGAPAALAPARTADGAGQRSGRPDPHGLGHPLARLSALNSQSRYLWSLGNPAPTYYGQTAAP